MGSKQLSKTSQIGGENHSVVETTRRGNRHSPSISGVIFRIKINFALDWENKTFVFKYDICTQLGKYKFPLD